MKEPCLSKKNCTKHFNRYCNILVQTLGICFILNFGLTLQSVCTISFCQGKECRILLQYIVPTFNFDIPYY